MHFFMTKIILLLSICLPVLGQTIPAWQNPNNPADLRLAKPGRVRVVDGVSRPWVQVQAEWVQTVSTNARPAFAKEHQIRSIATNWVDAATLDDLPPPQRLELIIGTLFAARSQTNNPALARAADIHSDLLDVFNQQAEALGGGVQDPNYGLPAILITNRTLRVVER